MAQSSNIPEVPMLIPYDFVHVIQTPAQIAAEKMYDWEMTPQGYLRKDKIQEAVSSDADSTDPTDTASEQSSEDFYGLCYDMADDRWSQSYEFDPEGMIDEIEDTYFTNVQDAHHGCSVDLPKALQLVADTCHATGCIYLNGCKGDHDSSNECTDFRSVMSGFYLPHGYFLTSAHFSICGRAEMVMKIEGSDRGRVSTAVKPSESFSFPPNKALLVHLVHRDVTLDYALFRLDKNQKFPQSCVTLDRLLCTDDLDYQTDLANRRAFTMGYNQKHNKAKFPGAVKKTLAVLTPQKRKQLKETPPPVNFNFSDMFSVGHKSLTVGRLYNESPEGGSTSWSHLISGWHGISGAMVACMDKPPGGEPKICIVGIFKGGVKGNHNMMVPFTAEILNKIREVVGTEKGCAKGKWYNKGKEMGEGLRKSLRTSN